VDGKAVVVSGSSVRRDIYLNDEDGTVCLTVNEIFENLALMGYETASDKLTFYKGSQEKDFQAVTQFFQNILAPPVVVGEGSEQPTKPQPTSSTAPQEISTQVATASTSRPPKDSKTYKRTKRGRNTKVPQSGDSPKKVGDEAINEEMLDSMEKGYHY
ncbi:hypothetical protein Tco_0335798, partial [Tanacetum coccineum]